MNAPCIQKTLFLLCVMTENAVRPTGAEAAVLVKSVEMPADAVLIQGPDFNKRLSLSDLMASYRTMGFQASGLAEAIDIIENMASNLEQSLKKTR